MKQNLLKTLLCCAAVIGLGVRDLHADDTMQPKLWRPTVINNFSMEDNGWMLRNTQSNHYDLFTGFILDNEAVNYNQAGEITSTYKNAYQDGVQMTVSESKYFRPDGIQTEIYKYTQYDPILQGFWVLMEKWDNYINGEYLDEPVLVRLEKKEINRNEAGNITSIRTYYQDVISNPDV